jgi:hypothetical protein
MGSGVSLGGGGLAIWGRGLLGRQSWAGCLLRCTWAFRAAAAVLDVGSEGGKTWRRLGESIGLSAGAHSGELAAVLAGCVGVAVLRDVVGSVAALRARRASRMPRARRAGARRSCAGGVARACGCSRRSPRSAGGAGERRVLACTRPLRRVWGGPVGAGELAACAEATGLELGHRLIRGRRAPSLRPRSDLAGTQDVSSGVNP